MHSAQCKNVYKWKHVQTSLSVKQHQKWQNNWTELWKELRLQLNVLNFTILSTLL